VNPKHWHTIGMWSGFSCRIVVNNRSREFTVCYPQVAFSRKGTNACASSVLPAIIHGR